MSWIYKLYETYEKCQSMVGKIEDDSKVPLLPICHTTQNAHIQITIDSDGNFLRAKVIFKDDAQTIIPCTEDSAGRAGKKPVCHPLCDSLQFVAGDFFEYGGVVTSGYSAEPHEPYIEFVKNLESWCVSTHKHEKAISILTYIKKKNVIADLILAKILYIDNNGKLIIQTKEYLEKYFGSKKNIPKIFQVIPVDSNNKTIDQGGAFVRWCIEKPGELQSEVWRDSSLWRSWANYYSELEVTSGFCYVLGEKTRLAVQHPKKITKRHNNAKLISSNDTSGFTFRGRFNTAEQACGVDFEVTQKAHSALRWLISRQGYQNDSQVIVAWAVSGAQIPDLLADPLSILGESNLMRDEIALASTAQVLALKLKEKIAGYKSDLGETTGVVVMGLDSATPGRMAITFYRELTGSDFLNKVDNWHESCAWIHNYGYNKEAKKFVGAPAPKDIAEAAYGSKVDTKLKKTTIERVLPCIIDNRQIPRDIVESAVRRACNRVGMENWEWEKTLSIACALYKKLKGKEDYNMALDENRKTRSYLYGRLLAVADCLESFALYTSEKKRPTNAARLMQRFADRPCSTWRTIELMLTSYKARLGGRTKKYQDVIDNTMNMFGSVEDFTDDKPLSGEFLLGYHCQRAVLIPKKGEPTSIEDFNADKE